MKKQFVTYPIALALKELGFDDFKMFGWYIKEDDSEFGKSLHIVGNKDFYFNPEFCFKAPLYQQVEEWLREKHSLFIEIDLTDNTCAKYYQYCIVDSDDREYDDEEMIDQASHIYNFKDKYETYPKAREAAILQAIEIIKNK